jgi:protein tyrosine phosphatase (PTP) superfamily phosphohydrolase (DUF442 family)
MALGSQERHMTRTVLFVFCALALSACSSGEEQSESEAKAQAEAEDAAPEHAGPLPIVSANIAGLPDSVVIGDVIVSGKPTMEGMVNARDSGATLVINTQMQKELTYDERQVVQGLGMRYLDLGYTPDTLDDVLVDTFIFEMKKHKPEDGKLLLHCSSGNRAAALWAMYEIKELKVDPGTAVDRARKIAPGLSTELVIDIGDYARRVGAL